MADLDGDGKRDLISGGFDARAYIWPGLGARRDLVDLHKHVGFKGIGHVATHAADWDGDGDLDLLVGARRGQVFLLRNNGDARFGKPERLKGVNAPGGDAGPHAADWDGDGLTDLLVGDDFGGVTLYRNIGTNKRPKLAKGEVLLKEKGGRIATPHCRTGQFCARRAKPWVVDWNGDKKPDLLVGDVHDHRTPENRSNDELRGFVWLYVRR